MTPPAASDLSRAGRRLVVLCAATLAVELVYVYVISAGTFTHWHFYVAYLNDLADGFRHGHLHLAVEPAAALAAHPRDPAYQALWYWDTSLYHGHYYLYWGPVPALLLAAVKTLCRISSAVGDEPVVFGLATLQLLAGALFVERAGRRLFDRPPLVLEVAAIFVVGLANPTLYNLARAAVYEAAIVGGHAFLLLGLVFAFDAVWEAEPRRAALAAAGACWAGALGCRISIAPTVALLVVTTIAGAISGRPGRARRAIRAAIWLGGPVALGFLALLAYNRLRFDAWFEFGRNYQLTWLDLGMGPRFIPANLYAYLMRPPLWSCRFPFAFAIAYMGARAFPSSFHLPAGYFVAEQVAGLLPTIPWCWFSLVALAAAARAIVRTRQMAPRSWAVLATAIAATVGVLPGMMFPSATNRYLGDVVGGVALLGTLGVFIAWQAVRTRPRLRRLVAAAALVLAIPSVVAGFALGVSGQYGHFAGNNPPLYQKLVQRFSVCRGAISAEPK